MEANPETAGPSESFRGEQATGQERERGGAGPSARTEWLEGMGAPATRRPHAPEVLVVCLRVATRGQLLTAAAPGDLAMDPAPGGPGRPGGTAPLFRSPSCSLTSCGCLLPRALPGRSGGLACGPLGLEKGQPLLETRAPFLSRMQTVKSLAGSLPGTRRGGGRPEGTACLSSGSKARGRKERRRARAPAEVPPLNHTTQCPLIPKRLQKFPGFVVFQLF